MRHYIVEPGGIIKPEPDFNKLAIWCDEFAHKIFEEGGRRVDKTLLTNGVEVSTVFLPMDHGRLTYESHDPILFETMIFGGVHDGFQDRYTTVVNARLGHAEAVKMASEAG